MKQVAGYLRRMIGLRMFIAQTCKYARTLYYIRINFGIRRIRHTVKHKM